MNKAWEKPYSSKVNRVGNRTQPSSKPLLALLNLPNFRAINLQQKRELVLDTVVILSSSFNLDNLIYFLRQSHLVNQICWGKIAVSLGLTECST